MKSNKFSAIVIGASAGGFEAIQLILSTLPKYFSMPIIIALHRYPRNNTFIYEYLNQKTPLFVKEASLCEDIKPGCIYFAPPNYHLLIELNKKLSLSVDEKVNYSRPSIDVLFETAAEAYRNKLIGILLTGANKDGAEGLKKIKSMGGLTLVQNPNTAQAKEMPQSAINLFEVDYILNLDKISDFLLQL